MDHPRNPHHFITSAPGASGVARVACVAPRPHGLHCLEACRRQLLLQGAGDVDDVDDVDTVKALSWEEVLGELGAVLRWLRWLRVEESLVNIL